jgi:RimJ/RimL family protein N-acetyltransferase
MSNMPELQTERLSVRPFVLDDLDAVFRMLDVELADAEFGSEGAGTREQREEWLRWSILSYEQLARLYQPPDGDRAIALRATGDLIGACGLVPSFGPFAQLPGYPGASGQRAHNTPAIGLFYAVAPEHQRRGYAFEAARALVDFAFNDMDLDRIVATTTFDNAASVRVMEKLGMRIERNPLAEPAWFQVVGHLGRDER